MFTPENKLEEMLIKAAKDAESRMTFYTILLEADIYIINQNKTIGEKRQMQIQPVEADGKQYLPIFSSVKRITESIDKEVTYIQMRAKDFFNATIGANIILNPMSECGKKFVPEEIQGMLDGSIFYEPVKLKENTEVMLGQPANYPQELVNALINLFSKYESIKAAYLANYYNPKENIPPHPLIGVDLESDKDREKILGEAGVIVTKLGIKTVDFIQIGSQGSGDISRYLTKETKAFYERR